MTSDKIKLIRANNLRRIIEKVGKGREVAEIVECDAVYLSQITNAHRVMGERFAARVEKAFGMTEGEMSIDPDEPTAAELYVETYRSAIQTVLSLEVSQVKAIIPMLETMQNKAH